MVCMPALSFYLSYPCCGTGNFRKKAKDKASFTYLGRNNKSSGECFLWSSVGFVLFYAPLTFGSTFGEFMAGSSNLAADHCCRYFINTFMG